MTTAEHSPEALRRALWENDRAPNGLLRNARAEELVAAAEAAGDPALLRQALFGAIRAYEYSTERGKMLVPFARLLQEWDRDPSAFCSSDTHTFHWVFKWVSSGMLTLPEIPLATMEQWLAEMERRYRTAGYSERAVRQAEYELAVDTGDSERAERAFAAWTAADRDEMANCHACEINAQGSHWRGEDDEKALQVWAPVLDGTSTCMEEPHRVLAKSLLPLVRTGRQDQARAHHLRGYRMARGNESLLPSVGLHIEFCALTGNEARGLELLAEHAAHLASDGNPWARLQLLTGTLVLLRRLLALGAGDQPAVPYQGEQRTVRDLHDLLDADATAIAARFDARNGSTVVSGRLKRRLEQEPLLAALPLGVRPSTAVPAAAPAPAAPEPVRDDTATLAQLVAEARRLRGQGHPGADAAWDRVAAVATDADTARDPLLAADLLDHRALAAGRADDGDARERFERVVAAYREAGEPGRAVLAELRVAVAALRAGAGPDEARALFAQAAASAEALDPAEPTRVRRIAAVALMRAKAEAMLDHDTDDHGAGRLDAALAAFEERFAPYLDADAAGGGVDDLLAEADETRADLAWQAGDAQAAHTLLTRAARRSLEAGRPWQAAAPLATRARLLLRLGRTAEAEESAREAYGHSAELTSPHDLAGVRLTLAEALYAQDGKEAEAAEYALEAAHWYDAAGDTEGAGAYARLVLGRALGEAGRSAEAAEVLESALPDLLEHGDDQAVQARDALARNLRALGDHRGAAEQYLRAAEVAAGWEHQGAHAQLATLAAENLARLGELVDEAAAAYHRAIALWEQVGEPRAQARALRSLAWLEAGRGDRATASELMGRALTALEGDGPVLLEERAHTWAQMAELLVEGHEAETAEAAQGAEGAEVAEGAEGAEAVEGVRRSAEDVHGEALELLDRAQRVLADLGPDVLGDRVRTVFYAAWLERKLHRPQEAEARLRSLARELEAIDTEEARGMLTRVRARLEEWARED
ncbi:tetratricopeptide repeat protein [Streptomyces sp. enrichment culture]|uniref:tetratricopeptide repeat protein n=1 Tax=Streptomyces sp. enrichment culture TaxID=1795815 RepID=UPI003F578C8F